MVITKIDKEILRLVTTPMGGSMAYNPAAARPKKQAKKKAAPTPVPKEAAAKRRRKAVGASCQSGIEVPEEKFSAQIAGEEIRLEDDLEVVGADDVFDSGVPDEDGQHAMWNQSCFFPEGGPGSELKPSGPPNAKTREITFLDDLLQVFSHVVLSQKDWLCQPFF